MAAITNTFSTYDAKGIREDLSNVIYDISPEDTPFMSRAGRAKAENTLFEWQTDSLAAASSSNAHIEGDDVSAFEAAAPTSRVGNYMQISRKTLIISGTEEAVDKAGRKSEFAYQMAKRSAELKRDMETILLSANVAIAGSSAVARSTAGLRPWVKTNTSLGATGANSAYTSIPTGGATDGTQRAFTETLLKDVIQKCWTEGASPDTVMVGAFNKQTASGFAGVATKNVDQTKARPATIVGSADVYVSDFGTLSIVPNRFQRARDGWVLDFEYVEVAYLRPFRREKLAKTGDAEKAMLLVEYGLKVKQEKALGLVADLTTA